MDSENIVFIDVETRRASVPRVVSYLTRNVQPDKRLTDPEKIEKSLEEKRAAALEDTPLRPMWGEIAMIGMAVGLEQKEVVIWEENGFEKLEAEKQTLSKFNSLLHQHVDCLPGQQRALRFCGFNVGFDLRFLWFRMLVHGIRPVVGLAHDAPPWSDRIIDLRAILSGGDRYAKGTLQDYVVALGGFERAEDIPGSEVPQALEDGRYKEVAEHCLQDVRDCRRLWRMIYER